ncbi:maleylpyruvate isomerase family mycothiol-dependent enzyme [Nocardioides sp. SYSU DS0663]|uniref:maleylpyruvate isomerase family mycothiol-dependent enzyme n=1 Tax=Nocardioides sp. SYSU DS0663 TaxID=3416445 RepID=UPI003F4B3249
MTDHWETVAAERRAFADELDTLDPEQWAAPSLCSGWTVKDVVAHVMVGPTASTGEVLRAMLAARGRFHVANDRLVRNRSALASGQLVQVLRDRAGSRFRPPGHDSSAPLADLLVHRQDVLVPLGLPDDRPPAPWGPVLELLLGPKARSGFVPRGRPDLTYVATDLDRSYGTGPRVEAPAAALALALMRRTARVGELDGPGAESLRRWAATE